MGWLAMPIMPMAMAVIMRVRPQQQVDAAAILIIVMIVGGFSQQQMDRFLQYQERNEGQTGDEHGPRIYLIVATIAAGKGTIERVARVGQLMGQRRGQQDAAGGHVADRKERFGGVDNDDGGEDGQEGGDEYGRGDDHLEGVYAHVQR